MPSATERRQAVLSRLRTKHGYREQNTFTIKPPKLKQKSPQIVDDLTSDEVEKVRDAIKPRLANPKGSTVSIFDKDMSEQLRQVFTLACTNNNMETILYLHSIGIRFSVERMLQISYDVAQAGHVDVLRWLKVAGTAIPDTEMCIIAAQYGRINILEWAECEGYDFSKSMQEIANECGNPDLTKWVKSRVANNHDPMTHNELCQAMAVLNWSIDDEDDDEEEKV